MFDSDLTRRHFLALGAAGLAGWTLFGDPGRTTRRPVSWLDVADFSSLEGERVVLRAGDGRRFAGRVVQVENRDRTHRGTTVEQISVFVRTGLREVLPQQQFEVDHPRWGAVSLFMVPVVSRSRAIEYEATISRLVG